MTVRILDAQDLSAALAAAQQALQSAPPGTSDTWQFPAGTHVLPVGASLGSAGQSLTLRGNRTTLTLGAAAPIPGDAVALELVGTDVTVDGISMSVRATGAATAVRVRATAAVSFSGLVITEVRGTSATGVDATGATGSLAAVTVGGVRAVAGDAVGVFATGGFWALTRLTVGRIAGSSLATAVRVLASSLTAVTVRVGQVSGGTVEAFGAVVTDELTLLDTRVDRLSATGPGTGISVACAGDVALRGVSVGAVEGARAFGAFVLAGNEFDWLGGRIVDVRGTSGGAAGARVFVAPGRASITVADLELEAIRAAAVGAGAAPPDSWRDWLNRAVQPLADGDALPAWPVDGDPGHAEDVVGLQVCAPVDEDRRWLDTDDPGAVQIGQTVLRRISGTALQVDADLRDVELRAVLAWTALRGGWLTGERLLLAQATWHRHGTGLEIGPCSLVAADSLLTGTVTGPALVLRPEAEVEQALVVLATAGLPPFEAEPNPLPYVLPGPTGVPAGMRAGGLPPAVAVDLRLRDTSLHARAVRVPGDDDDAPVWVGAIAPDTESRCELNDPVRPSVAPAPPVAAPGPPVDYRARDARSVLALMADRARQVMPGWTDTGPADETVVLLELLAERLDHLAYRQEVAVAEAYLPSALQRRSVEEHARLVDYLPDPGLSATTLIRFRIDDTGLAALGLDGQPAGGSRLIIGADTLVVNQDASDRLLVFGTESDLAIDPGLDTILLADEADLPPGVSTAIEPGDTSAVLDGDLIGLETGRWLAIIGVDPQDPERTDPEVPSHIVRLTAVELGTDTTRVSWDPRRPAPARYERANCRLLGNVVPAHHGLPLTPVSVQGASAVLESEDLLRPWRERLTVQVPAAGSVREVPLPVESISVQATGWPFPGQQPRAGRPELGLDVDGEPWQRVDDLVLADPADEVFALRTGADGSPAVRVGDGRNGASLPARDVSIDIAVRVGIGAIGNVTPGSLTRLLALGPGGDADAVLAEGGTDRFELIRATLLVDNPVAGVEGRDPEELERIRYRAPLGVRDLLSAVVPADYERLVTDLPEVAAARVRVREEGVCPVVQVTLLLRDEDELAAAGEYGAAERLRRWATARERLENVRLVGYDVELVPPRFVPLDLDLSVEAAPWTLGDTLEQAVREALAGNGGLFDPDISGLGGDVHLDAIHRAVLAVPGVASARVRRLRRLEPGAPEWVDDGVLPVAGDEVAVLRHPYGPAFVSGLLTVDVCRAAS